MGIAPLGIPVHLGDGRTSGRAVVTDAARPPPFAEGHAMTGLDPDSERYRTRAARCHAAALSAESAAVAAVWREHERLWLRLADGRSGPDQSWSDRTWLTGDGAIVANGR